MLEEPERVISSEITRSTECSKNAFLVPISKLPVEILREIFLLLCLSENYCGECDNGQGYDWSFSAVCRQWREIALGYPSLWTEIDSSMSIHQVKTYLSRSSDADLYVKSTFPRHKCADLRMFYVLISAVSDRIREFFVNDASEEEWALIDIHKIFSACPMTRLRRLRLFSEDDDALLLGATETCEVFTPAVHLDHLTLRRVSILWKHHSLHGLSELFLEEINIEHQPTLSELLDILESCPSLKVMKLHDAGPKSADMRTSRSITMSHLQDIAIEDFDFSLCKDVFDSIVILSDTVLSIGCYNYPFRNPVPFPVKVLENQVQLERTSAEITFDECEVSFSSCEEYSGDTCTTLTLIWDDDAPDFIIELFRSIRVISRQLHCENITALDLEVCIDHNHPFVLVHSFWSSLFDLLHTVRDLKITLEDTFELAKSFILALSETIDNSIKLPSLQTLDIVGANFQSPKSKRGLREDYYTVLLNHLTYRYASCGKRLNRFSLIHVTGVKKRQFKALWDVEFSDEVCWDPGERTEIKSKEN